MQEQLIDPHLLKDHPEPVDVVGVRMGRYGQIDIVGLVVLLDMSDQRRASILIAAVDHNHRLVGHPLSKVARLKVAEAQGDSVPAPLASVHRQEVDLVAHPRVPPLERLIGDTRPSRSQGAHRQLSYSRVILAAQVWPAPGYEVIKAPLRVKVAVCRPPAP
jgi:hypothetical protein